MSECRRILERLTSYADRALDPREQADVEQHLGACRRCRQAAVREEGGRAILKGRAGTLKSEPLPPGLRSRCEALARRHAAPPVPWSRRLVPLTLTALLIVFTGSALFSLATRQSDTLLAAQLTADHSTCFQLFADDTAGGVEARDMERMLSERHGWDVHLPPSSVEAGVQLIGARRCLYADGQLPHAMYRVNGQDVSLYMLDGVNRAEADVLTLGHRSRIWSRGATTYVLVARADAAEMTRGMEYLMQETR